MMALNMKKGLGPRLSRRGPSVRDSGLLTAGLGMFIVLAAAGSDLPAAAARSEGSQQPLQHEVSVVLKLVHVYVTDKKGRPVEDLALDDFSATDDGRPVKLTEFERHVLLARSEQAEPPPPAGPQAVETIPVRQIGEGREAQHPHQSLEENPRPATHNAPVKEQ